MNNPISYEVNSLTKPQRELLTYIIWKNVQRDFEISWIKKTSIRKMIDAAYDALNEKGRKEIQKICKKLSL